MLKRLSLAFAGLFAFASVALAAGTIPISLTQRFDNTTHLPLAAGQIYFIQAGTTSTPQNAFQDSALTIPYPNPLTLDAGGDIPQLFFADGSIKIRITNSVGVQQIVQDNILVIGPSSGGGGGGTVDATTILATGDIKVTYGTGVLSGFVRANGRTIGSATSGATERANADTQALFLYLWGTDANLTVSTGRGVSAAADWAANKTIALPDARSRGLAGLGDMGNSDNSLLSGLTFTSGNSTTLGSLLGAGTSTIAKVNLPNTTFAVTIPSGQGSHSHNFTAATTTDSLGSGGFSETTVSGTGTTTASTLPAMSGTAASGGSGTALSTVSPYMLVTLYLKL